MRRWLVLAACVTWWPAAPAWAQTPAARDCEIIHADDLRAVDQGLRTERLILRGQAHVQCGGGVVVRADSMVSHTATGRREFIGDVLFEDTVKSLTADRVDYEHTQGRLIARGHVVLTDLEDGSVVRDGSELEYFRATQFRPESRTIVRGRPHATLYEARPPGGAATGTDAATRPIRDTVAASEPGEPIVAGAGADTAGGGAGMRTPGAAGDTAAGAPPLEIDADRMEILGEHRFRAIGDVEMERGETHGSAAEAEFDQLHGRFILVGDAMIEGETFTLTGKRIIARLDGEELREVRALEDAILLAEEMRVDAPELQIYFREGAVHRLIAVRLPDPAAESTAAAAPPGGAVVAARPDSADASAQPTGRAAAEPPAPKPAGAGRLAAADSAAGGAMTGPSAPATVASVRTVGPQPRVRANDFWLVADSIDALAPGQRLERVVAVGNAYGERAADSLTARLPELIARDWLRGDTITGYFAVVPVADTTAAGAAPAADDTAAAVGGAPADSVRERTVLERLVAVGLEGTAQSLYRIQEEGSESGPSVNYLTANRIVLFLRDGEVTSVEADGPIEGYHLQPRNDGGGDPDPGVADAAPPAPGPASSGR